MSANEAAFPVDEKWTGLTRREYFAGLAMQGIITNDKLVNTCVSLAKENRNTPENIAANRAVRFADALLKELAK